MAVVYLYSWIVFAFCGLPDEPPQIEAAVIQAFAAVHEGYSSDEVLLDDRLNARFLAACQARVPDVRPGQLNWVLLNLRKKGKLKSVKTTRRGRSVTEDIRPVAEIVTRSLIDRFQVSIDRIMAEPAMRREFDRLARDINETADLYQVRKAAFQLRKTRQLRPELITRIATWNRRIQSFSIADFRADETIVPPQPGIYIFHDDSGYLYIGQSENVRKRLSSHVNDDGNIRLAEYLIVTDPDDVRIEIHVFPVDSRAKELMVRRAYESELIRSRQPRFNVLP